MSEKNISLEITKDQALVLYEFLARVDTTDEFRKVTQHVSEEVVMWKLEALLETILTEPFEDGYPAILNKARATVANEAGFE